MNQFFSRSYASTPHRLDKKGRCRVITIAALRANQGQPSETDPRKTRASQSPRALSALPLLAATAIYQRLFRKSKDIRRKSRLAHTVQTRNMPWYRSCNLRWFTLPMWGHTTHSFCNRPNMPGPGPTRKKDLTHVLPNTYWYFNMQIVILSHGELGQTPTRSIREERIAD